MLLSTLENKYRKMREKVQTALATRSQTLNKSRTDIYLHLDSISDVVNALDKYSNLNAKFERFGEQLQLNFICFLSARLLTEDMNFKKGMIYRKIIRLNYVRSSTDPSIIAATASAARSYTQDPYLRLIQRLSSSRHL